MSSMLLPLLGAAPISWLSEPPCWPSPGATSLTRNPGGGLRVCAPESRRPLSPKGLRFSRCECNVCCMKPILIRTALSAEEWRRVSATAARRGLTKMEHVTRLLRASLARKDGTR